MNMSLENSIINDNISVTEVEGAIDYLKHNKSPGIDSFPAEFVKSCKSTLSSDITLVLNYIIRLRDQGCSQQTYSGRYTKSPGGVQSGNTPLQSGKYGARIVVLICKIQNLIIRCISSRYNAVLGG